MATFFGTQETNRTAAPPVKTNPTDQGNPKRVWFDFTVPAATVLVADVIQLAKIPNGARLLEGVIKFQAAGGSATLALGDGTTAAKFMAATSVVAAGKAVFADTIALQFGAVQVADVLLTATVAGSALPAAMQISGWFDFLL